VADDPTVQSPDLRDLAETALADGLSEGALVLTRARVTGSAEAPASVRRIRVSESALRQITLAPGSVPGLALADVTVTECGLSNLDGREGSLRRVAIEHSQMVGFGLNRGEVRDLRVTDASLEYASFAGARLREVIFERVNLCDASFMDARLDAVSFVSCRLRGADFRGARLSACAIRGSSLDGVLGVESLAGVRMPWPDVLESTAALAMALGITIED
jgi:uncharacterized protein YjbI with pentapeptide repeats